MGDVMTPFEFRECVNILKSTGRKAGNLRELRDGVAMVSDGSIFHHTCQYFLKGRITEYTNDFAQWAGEGLEERALSEHLSNIDPYACGTLGDVRSELLRVIDSYLEIFPEPREAMPGDEFFFNEPVTLVAPVGIKAGNLAEFLIAVKFVDAASLYYHFYEARLRLGGRIDDFTKWFIDTGRQELAEKIRKIDPFMHNLDGIREHLVEAVEAEVKKGMEVI
ncbi:MAG: DUF5752 family protein [Nitrospirota bacterium]|nr:DUF5752 family protein [Nitrospirota bacterium]